MKFAFPLVLLLAGCIAPQTQVAVSPATSHRLEVEYDTVNYPPNVARSRLDREALKVCPAGYDLDAEQSNARGQRRVLIWSVRCR